MRKYVCMVGLGCLSAAFAGETFTIVNGASDWSDPASYGETTRKPGVGDTVIVPADCEVYIGSSAQADYVSQFERIKPESESSRIVVTVPENESFVITCGISAVNCAAAGKTDFTKGVLVKRGKGLLTAGGGLKLPASNSAETIYDCWVCMSIEEGEFSLPQDISTPATYYLGYISVSNGATFTTAARASDYTVNTATTVMRGIFGEGTVRNSDKRTLQINGDDSQEKSVFSGVFEGSVYVSFLNDGRVDLLGTASTASSYMSTYGSTLGVMKFGNKGEPSSLGAVSEFYIANNTSSGVRGPSRIVYLGTGETTDRTFGFSAWADCPSYFDGGVNGGLNLAGRISHYTRNTTTYAGRTLVFSGDHTNACVVSGELYGSCYVPGGSFYDSMYFAKDGSGTWRFSPSGLSDFPNGFDIREGTLAFDSIDEKGRFCSLGSATNLTDGSGYAYTPQVEYAYRLGTTNATTKALATMDYVGAKGGVCSTRPIALAGDGCLKNDTDKRLRFVGVSSLSAGKEVKMFTLGGSGVNSNEFADITDGAGKTGLVKDGTGTWVISGDLAFSGPLEVKRGTLVVRKTTGGNYTWFRWTGKQTGYTDAQGTYQAGHDSFWLALMGIYDSNTYCLTHELPFSADAAGLEPGHFAVQTCLNYTNEYYSGEETVPARMFKNQQLYSWHPHFFKTGTNTAVYQRRTDPKTWLSVVIRLPDGTAPAASFDFANLYGNYNSNSKYSFMDWSLEGSVDGLHWTTFYDVQDMEPCGGSWYWAGSKTALSYTERNHVYHKHEKGFPVPSSTNIICSTLGNVGMVSVAPGAKLVAEKAGIELSKVRIDAQGAGTFDGFEFAANGEIDLLGDPKTMPAFVSAKFDNTETTGNVSSWAVSVNGTLKPGWKVAASADGINIYKSGAMLIVR